MLLTLLDPVALPVNSSRNTRARAEEPPGEMIMIVLFGYDLLYYIPPLSRGFPASSHYESSTSNRSCPKDPGNESRDL